MCASSAISSVFADCDAYYSLHFSPSAATQILIRIQLSIRNRLFPHIYIHIQSIFNRPLKIILSLSELNALHPNRRDNSCPDRKNSAEEDGKIHLISNILVGSIKIHIKVCKVDKNIQFYFREVGFCFWVSHHVFECFCYHDPGD